MKADKYQSTKAQISPELVARAKSGDHDAFSELYKQTSTVLYRSIRSMVRDEELAWDIQQDSYLKAYQNLDKLKEDGAFLSWLRTISVHVTATRMRQRLPINFTDMGDEEDAMPEQPDFSIDTQPELALDRKETARLVREILAELPEAQQLVLGMRYYEDLSVKEISELLNLAPSTVSTQLNRGRKKVEAAVRSLEKQGLKLYGLSPLAFLLALERNQEPVAIARNRVMQRVLTKTTELGGRSITLTAKPVKTGFFFTGAGKITAGVLGLALTGAAIFGLQGLLGRSAALGGHYQPTETMEASLLNRDNSEEPTPPASAEQTQAGQEQAAGGSDLSVVRPAQKLDYFVRVSDESCDRFSNGETDILYYSDGSVFRYDVAAGERELLTSQELPADADVGRSLIAVTAQRLYFRDWDMEVYTDDYYSLNYQGSDRQDYKPDLGDYSFTFENGWLILRASQQGETMDVLSIDYSDRQSFYGRGVAWCGAAEDGALYYLQLAEWFDSSEAVPEGGVDFRVFRQLPGDSSEEIGVWHGTDYNPDVAVRNDTIAIRMGDAPEEHYDTRSFKRLDGNNACGENLVWSFDTDSGTISLTGSGEMYDYYLMAPPWCQFRESIQALALPEGLTSIGESAFAHCSGLNAVSLPASLKTIGAYAFTKCGLSAAPELPEGLTEIGEFAFYSNTHLGEIRLPSTLSRIGQNAFEACGATAFHVAEGNSAFSSDACGVLFNGDKTELLYYPVYREGAYEIPASVRIIGNNAFEFCDGLTEIRFPDGLTRLGAGAFCACSGLTRLDLPETLTEIDSFAFSNCTGLTEVRFPAGLTCIKNGAFSGCHSLTSLDLPETLSEIGDYAFSDCSGLTELKLPEGLSALGESAFSGCDGLKELFFPATLASIERSGLNECGNLAAFHVAEGNPSYSSDADGVLFNGDKTKLICYPRGRSGAYEIPDSVTGIRASAFPNCDGLKEISLPAGLSAADESGLDQCSNLEAFHVAEGNPNYSSDADGVLFNGDKTKLICYPKGRAGGYKIPASVTECGAYAFTFSKNLTELTLCEGLSSIGEGSFGGCSNLQKLTFPAGLTKLPEGIDCLDTFEPDPDLTVYGTAESEIQSFAENHGFHFVPLGSDE
ncbi:MAG: sigma-70 family RNA polymerase sigma factor [Oscillospiraceae bacterium]|nr:sigma-70 family RNA polymerase sigma factor [Oscillospiraceae bacterium]